MNCESPTKSVRWSILRVVPGHVTRVVLLSGDWLRLATHWVGKTVICPETESCPLCELIGVRCFWYLPAAVLPGKSPCLLELSALSSADLEQRGKLFCGRIGSGIEIELTRRGSKSPIRSEIVADTPSSVRVDFQTWATALMAVYSLPMLNSDETIVEYGVRVRNLIVQRAELAAARLRASSAGRHNGR